MRPITITSNIIDQLVDEFKSHLIDHKNVTSRISYSKDLSTMYASKTGQKEEKPKSNIAFTAAAYLKMKALVATCPDEIGWHGIVRQIDDRNFLISDILVFPQVVSGTSVNPDQEEYAKWMMEMMMADDEENSPYFGQYSNIRFHGHSHVNMGVTPSGTDTTYQTDMLEHIKDYYIFLIINKSGVTNTTIYDVKNNIMYEDSDIHLHVLLNDNLSQDMWVTEQMKKVSKSAQINSNYSHMNYTEQYLQNLHAPARTKYQAPEKEKKTEKKEDKAVYWDPKLKLWVTVVDKNTKLYSYRKPDPEGSVVQLTLEQIERSKTR